jgi:hypothetical protein
MKKNPSIKQRRNIKIDMNIQYIANSRMILAFYIISIQGTSKVLTNVYLFPDVYRGSLCW